MAHNTDIVAGCCAFNWASFSYSKHFDRGAANMAEPVVETGEVAGAWFAPSGWRGDWHTWDIRFKRPFAATPVVLLTANKPADTPVQLNPAVLGMAQGVTPGGFR